MTSEELPMQHCQQCEHANPRNARFCMQCGMRLGMCAGCGNEISDDALFCPQCGQPAPAAFRAEPEEPLTESAERRQLTVMFCDLVGSTELSERLDPEDYRDALAAYQKKCQEIIGDFGGWIAQYLGDGLLAYFGYPEAHEDDATRALDAALGILSCLPELNDLLARENPLFLQRPLQLRLAVHTGPVVVGEIRPGEKQTELALGDSVNLTFRLLDHAAIGEVIISEAVKHLCDGMFHFQELGPKSLKGISKKVLLHRVTSANDARSRLDIAAVRGLGQLAGFREELALLHGRWSAAKDGSGQAFLICGDPGMGKSRLVLEFKQQIESEPHTWIECRCSPYGEVSAFHPIVTALTQLLGIEAEDAPATRFERLEAALRLSKMDTKQSLPLIASLLSLPIPEDYNLLSDNPETNRRQLMESIALWLESAAGNQPLVLVLEDMHWVDPSTLELVQLVLDRASATHLFMIITHRPSFQPPWPNRSHISHISMPRLSKLDAEIVVRNASKGKSLPTEVVEKILARTDGVPLFIEELTRTLIESDVLEEDHDRYQLKGGLDELSTPETLQGSLMARLDRLGPAKATAQLAAVLGRECDHSLLEAVSPLDDETLNDTIAVLSEADLLIRTGTPPRASYRFRHALIQDIAYQSLLKRTRQNHHARAASVLEAQFPEVVEARPELAARHYDEAQQLDSALLYWEKAANRASDRSAYVEAIAHAKHALNVLSRFTESEAKEADVDISARELVLQLLIGGASIATLGHGHADVQRSYERAQTLCQEVPDIGLVSQALVGLSAYYVTINELETGQTLANRLLSVAESSGEPDVMLAASLTAGIPMCFLGNPESSMRELERAISFYDPSRHRVGTYVSGQDPGVIARAFSAWSHWLAGYPDQAKARVEEGIALASEHEDPFSHAFALGCACILDCLRYDDLASLEHRANETITLCEELGFPLFLALGSLARGWVLSLKGDESGLEDLESARQLIDTTNPVVSSIGAALHADALCRLGSSREATAVIRAAVTMPKRAPFWDAELMRLEAESLRLDGESAHIVSKKFQQSLIVARAQGARSFELRTALNIVAVQEDSAGRSKALDVLREVFTSFSEGLNTGDLKASRDWLSEAGS